MQPTACKTCCSACVTSPPPVTPPENTAYSVRNFFAAGVLKFGVALQESAHCICSHWHAEDHWHGFDHTTILPLITTAEDDVTLRELNFLLRERFIALSWCLSPCKTRVYIRVYLIPHDLGGVQGKLRRRGEHILTPARKYLKRILPLIVQNHALWDGLEYDVSGSVQKAFLPNKLDPRTMAEIYGDLPSPQVDLTDPGVPDSARQVCAADSLPGLRSSLHDYQRRSVVAMICKETCSGTCPDPLYITLHSMDGEPLHFQPATGEVVRERPVVTSSRGGILCEELGTGKTVMILSLIMATLDELPAPEESILDTRPVLTPISMRVFSTTEAKAARKRASRGGRTIAPPVGGVPTLVEMSLHWSRLHPAKSGLRQFEDQLARTNLLPMLTGNVPFYHHFIVDGLEQDSSRRKTSGAGPRTMHITSATLVIVPPNLVAQWQREIQKHCEDGLRVLTVNKDADLPRPSELASNFDVSTKNLIVFSSEGKKTNITSLHDWNSCTCLPFPGTRVPRCQCDEIRTDVSSLLRVRWKRLVIDEGHVSATVATTLTPFAKLLSVERRWIVTGTPTTNMLGFSFGSISQNRDTVTDHDDSLLVPTEALDGLEDEHEGHDDVNVGADNTSRRWTLEDRQDLHKLATMISHFLSVPQFATTPKLFTTHVIAPLFDINGPRAGPIQVLEQVMQMAMVRHRISDVEHEVTLPPMRKETVLLDLHPLAVKSYNTLQSLIAINAVDSERVDQDYLFHARNTRTLLQIVENISQTLFWRTDDELLEQVRDALQKSDKTLSNAVQRNRPEDDHLLLKSAFHHLQEAMKDGIWRASQDCIDLPYEVRNIDRTIFAHWTRSQVYGLSRPRDSGAEDDHIVAYMHPDRLEKMREFVVAQPLASKERICNQGSAVCEADARQHQLHELNQLMRKGGKRRREEDDAGRVIGRARESAKKTIVRERIEELRKEYLIAQARLQVVSTHESQHPSGSVPLEDKSSITTPNTPSLSFLASSPLANVRIGSSGSSKQNYILREVLRHAPTEKFLIFSKSPLTLAHVAEGLDLSGIKYLQSTRVSVRMREQLVLTFETSDVYRVFLMELKHGARGLNMVTASRVLFCEPVWEADVETQAIKRAHRIGQTRPVNVKTLAIRGTSEEYMVNRRNTLKEQFAVSTNKSPEFLKEKGVRDFIANPTFLHPCSTTGMLGLDIPLLPISQGSAANRPGDSGGVSHESVFVSDIPTDGARSAEDHLQASSSMDRSMDHHSPPKKLRSVRFAD
ncbi:hypothetical protein PUNSTDRAFT_104552 [Punctularia strigosozonata HHB-11173 SS5]|uniref:uncharacterized protein n=1 Tax=Punctularia strigosozonata (strain HHB-11173) TaxID=741275 RepID=UPI00044162EC|nr:uncharacterized protein PUNSTDRAFT_104552 [Punctularia strigosozonata HHB-11173 SS5]EIN07069.1 hypothetical protein PUNSTDRAFT_104552 [Punctularia strigosozonata HHB-11173 SS5]